MTEAETIVLLGRVRARAHPSAYWEPAWRDALRPLNAGRAGTALVRYLNSLHASDDPTIGGFLHIYGPLPPGHPLAAGDNDLPAPPPRPTVPCDVCDSTGWRSVDDLDPSAGVTPCACPWGAQVGPAVLEFATPPATPGRAVDPPWRTAGLSPTEWTRRLLDRQAAS